MILSNLYLNCEDAFRLPGQAATARGRPAAAGTGATYRLYETGPIGAGRQPGAVREPRSPLGVPWPRQRRRLRRFCRAAEAVTC